MKGVYTEKVIEGKRKQKLIGIIKNIKGECTENINIERFHDNGEGCDVAYNVYKVTLDNMKYTLKKSDDYEIEVYEKFLKNKDLPVPKFEGWTLMDNTKWILLEYIPGSDIRKFNEDIAIGCAESLTSIFNTYWLQNFNDHKRLDNRFERYWARINKRAECLKDEGELSSAYNVFLERQLTCPRTLCNGDFLQYNAIRNDKSIILIDWAFGGIMPYSLDVARLICHGSEKYFPFPFYMTDEYRKIFLKEVYNRLNIKIEYRQFIWDVILSSLNECIEFIEKELNDKSLERDEGFKYYYKNCHNLAHIILKGIDALDI